MINIWDFKCENKFSDGLPRRQVTYRVDADLLQGKTCKTCSRCINLYEHGGAGYICRSWQEGQGPDSPACRRYEGREWVEDQEHLHEKEVAIRQMQLWSIYAKKPPRKLPIVFDGYGKVPLCPVCGKMPVKTDQCHWCGQRFIRDEELEEYLKQDEVAMDCPTCGRKGTMRGVRSLYNGHFHGQCKVCGAVMMQ